MTEGFYRTVTHPNGTASLEYVPPPRNLDTEKARLFPNGIPIRGDLTPEQAAWMRKRY